MKNKLIPSSEDRVGLSLSTIFDEAQAKDPFSLGETQSFVLRLGVGQQSTIERITAELEFHMRNFCTSYYCLPSRL